MADPAVVVRFKTFYLACKSGKNLGICDGCYRVSLEKILIWEPAWFTHIECADAFQIAMNTFRKDIREQKVNIYDR